MTVTYEVISIEDAVKRQLPGMEDWDGYYEDWEACLWRVEDGQPVELLATDGGEPEDNSFYRDGSWIAPALQEAYNLGWKHSLLLGNAVGLSGQL